MCCILHVLDKIEEKFNKLSVEVRIRNDSRMYPYSVVLRSRTGSHRSASEYHKSLYDCCLFCGTTHELTMAHLISELRPDSDFDLSMFGPPHYKDEVDVKSNRNFLLLCGTSGKAGTCHDMFDRFELSLVYDALHNRYTLVHVHSDHRLHGKVVDIRGHVQPYRRLLAWRYKNSISKYADLYGNCISCTDVADFSEIHSIRDDNFISEPVCGSTRVESTRVDGTQYEYSRSLGDVATCKAFQKHGSCRFGDKCKYRHDRPGVPVEPQFATNDAYITNDTPMNRGGPVGGAPSRRSMCFRYKKKGVCKYGDNCMYRHY